MGNKNDADDATRSECRYLIDTDESMLICLIDVVV